MPGTLSFDDLDLREEPTLTTSGMTPGLGTGTCTHTDACTDGCTTRLTGCC